MTPGQAVFEHFEKSTRSPGCLVVEPWERVRPDTRRLWEGMAQAAIDLYLAQQMEACLEEFAGLEQCIAEDSDEV